MSQDTQHLTRKLQDRNKDQQLLAQKLDSFDKQRTKLTEDKSLIISNIHLIEHDTAHVLSLCEDLKKEKESAVTSLHNEVARLTDELNEKLKINSLLEQQCNALDQKYQQTDNETYKSLKLIEQENAKVKQNNQQLKDQILDAHEAITKLNSTNLELGDKFQKE